MTQHQFKVPEGEIAAAKAFLLKRAARLHRKSPDGHALIPFLTPVTAVTAILAQALIKEGGEEELRHVLGQLVDQAIFLAIQIEADEQPKQ